VFRYSDRRQFVTGAYPAYAEGMDEAVVDVVVIKWIVQKLNFDLKKRQLAGLWQGLDDTGASRN
jgi:hypothetical protein